MSRQSFEFSKSVFINCPFDPIYRPLLRSLVFTVLDCDLQVRIASESVDSGLVRIEKIRHLISNCRYSIHDLSRMGPLERGELPRFNMPFELGLDLGCRFYGEGPLRDKQCLILDRELDRYRQVLSDIAGQDIRAHQEKPELLVRQTRGWLKAVIQTDLQSGSTIWQRFNEFTSWLELKDGFEPADILNLEIGELIEYVNEWRAASPRAS